MGKCWSVSAFSGFGGEVERRRQDYGESQSDVKLVSTFVPFIPATDVSRVLSTQQMYLKEK